MRSVLCQHCGTVLYQYCAGLLLIFVYGLNYELSFLFLLIAYFDCGMMFVFCGRSEINLSLVALLRKACGHFRQAFSLRRKIKGILIVKVCVCSLRKPIKREKLSCF